MANHNSKPLGEKRNLLRLRGAVLAGLLLLAFINVSCDSGKRSSPEPREKLRQYSFSITPADGETIRHLSQPIFVSFPQPVQSSDFTFKIEPDPGSWEAILDKSQKWVRLEHKNPFAPNQNYRIKLSVKAGRFESNFKTLPPDPDELLASDLARGAITSDEAAQYYIMRILHHKMVPEKYRYTKTPPSGTWDMLKAANLRDKLKPETVKALEPYMVRPDNPKSIYYKRLWGTGQSSSKTAPLLITTAYAAEPTKVVYHTDTGYTIEIYGDPGCAELVRKARRLIEEYKIYEKFERLLNRKTSDFGDKTLQIYIFSYLGEMGDSGEPKGFCQPDVWNPALNTGPGTATTWIAISARQVSSDIDLAATLAHEMFHSFQFAFSRYEQKWLVEGSAVWAQDFIGRDWNTEQEWLPGYTFNAEDAIHNQINERTNINAYGMYLFFYYLTRISSGGNDTVIRTIWENCAAKRANTFESVRTALPRELTEVLKEYALFTLDVEQYKGKFPDTVGAYGGESPLKLSGYHKFNNMGKIDANGTIETGKIFYITGMSIAYLKMENKAAGVTAPAIKVDLKEFLKKKAISIQAVIKYRNGRQEMEDWTGYEERIFCLANESQNFETLYLVASWAEETSSLEPYFLPIESALKEECLGAHLRIIVSDYKQKDEKITSLRFNRSTTTETLSEVSKVEFDLDLALVPPIPPVSNPMPLGDIKKLLPEEAQEVAEFLKYGTHYDMATRCALAVFRVKSCKVSSVSGTQKVHTDHVSYDDVGSLVGQYTSIYHATWSSEGLNKKTIDWIRYAEKMAPVSGAIKVHIDPKTKQIKWVYLDLPIVANCRIDWSYQKEGRQRENRGYKEIKESCSGSKITYISPHAVSKRSKDLPMNPDWRAKESTRTTASGGGKNEKSLDRETYDNYEKTKVVTTGKHVETIEWNLRLDVPPDIK